MRRLLDERLEILKFLESLDRLGLNRGACRADSDAPARSVWSD